MFLFAIFRYVFCRASRPWDPYKNITGFPSISMVMKHEIKM